MTSPDPPLASAVPGVLRTDISTPLMWVQIVSAVRVVIGRLFSVRAPSRSARRYRSASLVAASALPSAWRCRKSLSAVVTMFSISELARASKSGRVLIKIAGFGINSAACRNSASAARAVTHCFRTRCGSSSVAGGSVGRPFQGRSARQRLMFQKSTFCDMSKAYVAASDMSKQRVAKIVFLRHVTGLSVRHPPCGAFLFPELLWPDDPELQPRLPRQVEELPVLGDQELRVGGERRLEEFLVVRVAAPRQARPRRLRGR